MKYRHSYHAGNFADVHKHVTLLALLAALERKDKGFLYLETHAGRGGYDLSNPSSEASAGIVRLTASTAPTVATGSPRHATAQAAGPAAADELQKYLTALAKIRQHTRNAHFYAGSPLLAAHELRSQDRAVFVELVASEARLLEEALQSHAADSGARHRVERGDGFERLRAWLPPAERRGLTFIDPPYEESRDFDRVISAVGEAMRRFRTGVVAVWYPIKDERDTSAWRARAIAHARSAAESDIETLSGELWLYPRDSRVALNGSGMLIVNPPYLLRERMELWLPELHDRLDVAHQGGWRVE